MTEKMDDDNFGFSEKIINKINNILNSKTIELRLFEIMPVTEIVQNKCPIILLGNELGLESWCVKHVYLYCYNQIFNNYIKKQNGKSFKITPSNSESLVNLLNVALLLNPEVATFWNKRRELVSRSLLDQHDEIKFTALVLSWKGNCNEAFSYRRWLLDLMDRGDPYYGKCLTEDDLDLCYTTSCKYRNNYHSWNHRIWTVKTIMFELSYYSNRLLREEYMFTAEWITNHVSDFSGFNYRQFCIERLLEVGLLDTTAHCLKKDLVNLVYQHAIGNDLDQFTDEFIKSYGDENLVKSIFKERVHCACLRNIRKLRHKLEVMLCELQINNELIHFYKGHEALWYHRRYIIDSLLDLLCVYYGLGCKNGKLYEKNCDKCFRFYNSISRQNRMFSSSLYSIVIPLEKKFIHEALVTKDKFAKKHRSYLQHRWMDDIFN